jgi:hypothetical protein
MKNSVRVDFKPSIYPEKLAWDPMPNLAVQPHLLSTPVSTVYEDKKSERTRMKDTIRREQE